MISLLDSIGLVVHPEKSVFIPSQTLIFLGCIINPVSMAKELHPVVSSKNVNKGGCTHNHAHSLGVAQLQPCPYVQRWKHGNVV